MACCKDGLRVPAISIVDCKVLPAMSSPPFPYMFGLKVRPVLLHAFSFLREILGRLRIFNDKICYSLFFEVGRAGVVDSGVVSVGSPESSPVCVFSPDASIKFRPIVITSTTSCPLILSRSEKS